EEHLGSGSTVISMNMLFSNQSNLIRPRIVCSHNHTSLGNQDVYKTLKEWNDVMKSSVGNDYIIKKKFLEADKIAEQLLIVSSKHLALLLSTHKEYQILLKLHQVSWLINCLEDCEYRCMTE
ncbi:30292_t:CDS:2, partial [Racocetra persica]